MHCDCRAADDCRLRDLADEFSIKNPRGKLVNAPIVKKINYKTGLVFENAKCIKCGFVSDYAKIQKKNRPCASLTGDLSALFQNLSLKNLTIYSKQRAGRSLRFVLQVL